MQKYPETLIWLRAGEEINMDELDVIVRGRRDEIDNRDIEHRAREMAVEIDRKRNEAMIKYGEAMRLAGIEPPNFMTGEVDGYLYDHTVAEWVQENLVSGPDGKELLMALRQIKSVDYALKAARDAIIKLTVRKKDNGGQEELPA